MVHVVNVRIDAARNRARIVDVARRLVGARGSEVAIDDIARDAGVAVGTIYRHFPTKAALVAAVIEHSMEELAEAAEASAARASEGGDAAQELAGLFRAVARRHTEDAAIKEAAVALGAHDATELVPDLRSAPGSPAGRAWAAIGHLLELGIAAGSIRADLTPPDLLCLVAGLPTGPGSTERRDRYVEIVIDGVRAGAAARPPS